MTTQFFVNLPVRDLPASTAFFNALGYATNPNFSNDDASCIVVSDTIYVMLLVEPFFQGFTRKAICDARTHTEAILWKRRTTASCTSAASRISMATNGKSCTWTRMRCRRTDVRDVVV